MIRADMTWQLAIFLQILASAIVALLMRSASLSTKHVFFGFNVLTYIAIAVFGWLFVLITATVQPGFPPSGVLPYLIIEGIALPLSWLAQYKLAGYIGATSMVIVTIAYTIITAIGSIIIFHDPIKWTFVLGSILIVIAVSLIVGLQPDTKHKVKVSLAKKIAVIVAGGVFFGIGIIAEKFAVNIQGAWGYVQWGWTFQAIGAIALFMLFGRKELPHIKGKIITKGAFIGLMSGIAGVLYIYALSIGTLSQTVIAISGRAVVVMVLAAVIFRERNALDKRILAFVLTIIGVWLVLS